MRRARVVVSGRVQGVFYRASCAARARERGLGGSIRNLPDGRVEAVFEGPEDDVEAMIGWCRRGTEWADVVDLKVAEEEPTGEIGFRVAG